MAVKDQGTYFILALYFIFLLISLQKKQKTKTHFGPLAYTLNY